MQKTKKSRVCALSRQRTLSPILEIRKSSTHLVLATTLCLSRDVIRLELIGDLDVEIALILLVGLVLEDAFDLLALLDGEHFAEVEDGLLPVGVFGVWAGGEADGFVAGCEVDVEPGD